MKKLFTIFTAAALCLALSVSALAMPSDKKQQELPQELQETQEKLQSLSDKEKSAIYKLDEKLIADKKALIAAYEKYGVISSDKAEIFTEMLDDCLKKAKDGAAVMPGTLPGLPGKSKAASH